MQGKEARIAAAFLYNGCLPLMPGWTSHGCLLPSFVAPPCPPALAGVPCLASGGNHVSLLDDERMVRGRVVMQPLALWNATPGTVPPVLPASSFRAFRHAGLAAGRPVRCPVARVLHGGCSFHPVPRWHLCFHVPMCHHTIHHTPSMPSTHTERYLYWGGIHSPPQTRYHRLENSGAES